MSVKQGEYLKELRVKHKLSQEKLGEKLGLSRQSVSKWEQGYATPDTDNLIKLSELYGVSVDTILKCGEAEEAADPSPAEAVKVTADTDEKKVKKKKHGWFFISFPFFDVIAYAVVGAVFGVKGWAYGWLILLIIPLFYTTVIAVQKKKPVIFCYPVLVVLVYLLCGFLYSLWHPLWIIFLTIPIFYIIAAKAGKKQ